MNGSLRRGRARRPLLPLTAGIWAAALAAGCSGGGSARPDVSTADTTTAAAAAAAVQRAENDLQTDYETVIKNVLPSVVEIEARTALGSGIVFDNGGHIVTNAHVVGREKTFSVTVPTREQPMEATLVSSFPQQDLAVIRLTDVPSGLRAAKFGDSSKVAVGQIVLAMGSPLGLSSSVTQGIVSGVGRTLTESDSGGGTGATIANLVQTSAAINPGNSGGALVNLDSEVIGIPTLAAANPQEGDSAAQGIGFAIPVSLVKTVASQIVKNGKVTDSGRAALGITGRTVLGPDLQPAGVAVVSTTGGSAAAAAGIRAGDIITMFGATPVTTIESLTEAVAADRPGQKVRVTYTRQGRTKTAEVTLGRM